MWLFCYDKLINLLSIIQKHVGTNNLISIPQPVHMQSLANMHIKANCAQLLRMHTSSMPPTYPTASSIHIQCLPDCTGTNEQLLIVSRIYQHSCVWRVDITRPSTLTHTPAILITRSLGWCFPHCHQQHQTHWKLHLQSKLAQLRFDILTHFRRRTSSSYVLTQWQRPIWL